MGGGLPTRFGLIQKQKLQSRTNVTDQLLSIIIWCYLLNNSRVSTLMLWYLNYRLHTCPILVWLISTIADNLVADNSFWTNVKVGIRTMNMGMMRLYLIHTKELVECD